MLHCHCFPPLYISIPPGFLFSLVHLKKKKKKSFDTHSDPKFTSFAYCGDTYYCGANPSKRPASQVPQARDSDRKLRIAQEAANNALDNPCSQLEAMGRVTNEEVRKTLSRQLVQAGPHPHEPRSQD